MWEKEQKLDHNARATNQKIDLITNVLALFSTLLVLKSRQNKILLALAIGLATKTISAITAWRYLKATVAFSNLGVWQSGFLAGYTNPLDSRALLTTNDGGVLFNLNTMKLPATGAKFRLEASKDGYVFKPITGYAFNNKITIFTQPQCLMAEPNRLDTPKVTSDELEELGRPARLMRSLALGSAVACGTFYRSRSIVKALLAGTISATTALFALEDSYKKTLNPVTIFEAPQLKSHAPQVPLKRDATQPPPGPGDVLLVENHFKP